MSAYANGEAVPGSVLRAYGAPSLPVAVLAVPLFIYLPPYYGDDLGMSLGSVGAVLLIARLWDVGTDPLIGTVSDRLASRWGRRRPWIVAGIPLLLLAVWQLFQPPADPGAAHLLGWTLLATLAWTLISLPYNAWGAELSGDYHQRTRIYGASQAFAIIGTVVGIVLPAAVQASGGSRAEALAAVFWLVALSLPVAGLWLLRRVPDASAAPDATHWRDSLRLLRENAPFRRLVLAYLLNGIANGLPASLFLIFAEHFIGADERASGLLLLVYFGTGFLALPIWLLAAHRFSKHRVWCVAMLYTCAVFVWVPFLAPGQFWAFFAICLFSGAAVGADLALPSAMQADVVDEDAVRSGASRAGLYFALWGMATKLALALAVGAAYPLLDLVGFNTDAANTRSALMVLALLYGAGPVLIKLISVALMWGFPLTAERQASLRADVREDAANSTSLPQESMS